MKKSRANQATNCLVERWLPGNKSCQHFFLRGTGLANKGGNEKDKQESNREYDGNWLENEEDDTDNDCNEH